MSGKMALKEIGFVLVVGTLVSALVLSAVATPERQAQWEQARAEASAYCNQVYDDPSVYSAAVVGNHGGFHCVGNEDGPHLHAIPQKYKEQAYRAQQDGTDLGWDVATAHEHKEPREHYLIRNGRVLLPLLVGVVGIVVAAGFVQRYRHS